MGAGNLRNWPCWCNSGRKYKHCHLDRGGQEPIPRSVTEKQFKAAASKVCLHPTAADGDCGPIVRAHTIQRSGGLSRIARDGHVYHFDPHAKKVRNQSLMTPSLIGINKASTFTGFCREHDKAIFAPIEDRPFNFTREQVFLLGYRALCRELYAKETVTRQIPLMRQTDRGRSLEYQVSLQDTITNYARGTAVGLEDLRRHKREFDRILLTSDFNRIEFLAFETDRVPDYLCSGAIYPEYNLSGQLLQDLLNLSEPAEGICFSAIATERGGAFVFTWLSGAASALALATSFNAQPDDLVPHALGRFTFEFFENTFISPSWWDELPKETKRAFVCRANSGAHPDVPRLPTCLIDDGVRAVSWRVVRRLSSANGTT